MDNLSLHLNSGRISAGNIVSGHVSFDSTSAMKRKSSDFSVTLALAAYIHTSIPSTSGPTCHDDKMIYHAEQAMPTEDRVRLDTHFNVPFTYRVSETCPAAISYSAIAKTRHILTMTVRDLTLPFAAPQTIEQSLDILPADWPTMGHTETQSRKRVTCIASSAMQAGSKYFVQFKHASSQEITQLTAVLNSEIKVSNGKSGFNKKSARPLLNLNLVRRNAPNGDRVVALEADIPDNVDCSVDIPGFLRSYTIDLTLLMKDRSPISFALKVIVSAAKPIKNISRTHTKAASTSQIPMASYSLPPKSPQRKTSNTVARAQSTVGFDRPRVAPVPLQPTTSATYPSKSQETSRVESRKSSIRHLSMSQLTARAMLETIPDSTSMASSTPSSSRPNSYKRNSGSESDSSVPSTPRSLSSSVFDFTDSPTSDVSSIHTASPKFTSRHTKSASTSSFSVKRRSVLLKLGQKLGLGKDMEFSCCGTIDDTAATTITTTPPRRNSMFDAFTHRASKPTLAIPALAPFADAATEEEVDDASECPTTPGSEYSAAPSASAEMPPSRAQQQTPKIARRLSFRRSAKRQAVVLGDTLTMPTYGLARPCVQAAAAAYTEPRGLARHSISDAYFAGFRFEGLSSLDDLLTGADLDDDDDDCQETGSADGVAAYQYDESVPSVGVAV